MAQARASMNDFRIGRVLHEDSDFVTLEVAKRDDVTFHLQQNDEGETVGGDVFLTMLFMRQEDGAMVVWDPFEPRDTDT